MFISLKQNVQPAVHFGAIPTESRTLKNLFQKTHGFEYWLQNLKIIRARDSVTKQISTEASEFAVGFRLHVSSTPVKKFNM